MADFGAVGKPRTDEEIAAAGEVLVNQGDLSLDRIVQAINALTVSDAARHFGGYSPAFAAQVLNHPQLASSTAVAILKDANFDGDHALQCLSQVELAFSKLMDILTLDATSAVISANTTVTGTRYYRDLTVNGGVTLTVDGQPGIIIAYNLTCNGTITKTATGASGGAGSGGGGNGGRGGGGLLLFAHTLSNASLIRASGASGAQGSPSTSANGNAGASGRYAVIGSNAVGTGGRGGNASSYSGGTGGSYTALSYTTAQDLATALRKALVSWWLTNIAGKNLSTTYSFPNVYGPGGGEGADYYPGAAGGGGGGGGGQILVSCHDFNNTGTLSAVGGNGGSRYQVTGFTAEGGDGGTGGVIYVLYRVLTSTGTLNAAGGTAAVGGVDGAAGIATAYAVQ